MTWPIYIPAATHRLWAETVRLIALEAKLLSSVTARVCHDADTDVSWRLQGVGLWMRFMLLRDPALVRSHRLLHSRGRDCVYASASECMSCRLMDSYAVRNGVGYPYCRA